LALTGTTAGVRAGWRTCVVAASVETATMRPSSLIEAAERLSRGCGTDPVTFPVATSMRRKSSGPWTVTK